MSKVKNKYWHDWKHVKVLPKGHRYTIGGREFVIYIEDKGGRYKKFSVFTYPELKSVMVVVRESLWEARWNLEEYYYSNTEGMKKAV
jgi:hypothetical protein